MHDDNALTTARATRVLHERIWPAIHSAAVPFDVAWSELPGEPIGPAAGLSLDYVPYQVGTAWGPAWGTTWFRLRGTVPETWSGRAVEAVVDLGFDPSRTGFQCEALVHSADGTAIKSLNPRNQIVRLTDRAAGGEQIELYLEAASNPVILGEDRFRPTEQGDVLTSSPEPLYRTRRIDLAVFEEEVFELALDVEVLLELSAELPLSPRKMRILQALDNALDQLDLQRIPETAALARAQLSEVLSSPAEHSAHSISAIGHAHIDSAWLWPVRETVRKVVRTVASMTDLIERTDDYRYGMSSAQQYAWIKEHRPDVWERLKAAVAEGRFLPLGGMWVESDTVMPSGESLVRQFLYGQAFFEKEFGETSRGVWLPDSFGYSPALPQLMHRAGFEWFFTQKISWNQVNVFPHHTFLWEGIDGSRVLSHFPPVDTYNSRLSGAELARASRQFQESRIATGSIAPVGYGDGGGGTTREMVGRSKRLADLEGSAKVRWENPDAFYERTRNEIPNPPVWVGELYLELHRATLTSQHKTKQGNRRSEHLLVEAEVWAATAAVLAGLEYPYEELDALWQSTLLHQFHDILPGTSIAWVHREAQEQYTQIRQGAEAVIERSLAALTGDGRTELRVNPSPFTRATVPGLAAKPVAELTPPAGPATLVATDDGYVLENELIEVSVSHAGHITSAIDKATGRQAIAPGGEGGLLQLHQDFPNAWDAWDVDKFYRNNVADIRDVHSLDATVTDDGTATVTVTRRFSKSTVTVVIALAPGERTIRFTQETDWQETEKFLKVAFPLDVRAEHTIAETQFGNYKRVTHTNTSWEAARFETSMHRYVLAEEPGFGVALINDSIYGFDTSREVVDAEVATTLRLSLLRAPRFPDPRTDHGVQTHVYGLVVGADAAVATSAGAGLNLPERTVLGSHGFGPLVTVQGEGLVLSTVKLAHDRSGDLVVRVYEALGQRTTGSITVHSPVTTAREVSLLEKDLQRGDLGLEAGTVELRLKPFEVRTLRLSRA